MVARAAGVLCLQHPRGRARLGDARPGPRRRDDPAGLVPGDDLLAAATQTQGCGLVAGRAVELQVAPAHAGGLDLEHHLARARGRVGELPNLELAISREHDAAHGRLLDAVVVRTRCSVKDVMALGQTRTPLTITGGLRCPGSLLPSR